MSISVGRFARSTLIILLITVVIAMVADQIVNRLGLVDNSGLYAHPPNFSQWRHNQEFNYLFQTNDAGLREAPLPRTKPLGETRIFVVGDSFTEGMGIANEARFTNRLTASLSASSGHTVRFINGGLSGSGPRAYLEVAQHIGPSYEIDGLLVCLYANDVSNMNRSRWSWHARKLRTLFPTIATLVKKIKRDRNHQTTTKTQTSDFISQIANHARKKGIAVERIDHWRVNLPPDLLKAAQQQRLNPGILAFPLLKPNYYTHALDGAGSDGQGKMTNYFSALDALVQIGQAQGIPVAFVYIPSAFQYDPIRHQSGEPWGVLGGKVRAEWLREDALIQQRLKAWSTQRQVAFLDLTPHFRQAVQEGAARMTFEIDDHWNSKGHHLAATVMGDWLRQETVFDDVL